MKKKLAIIGASYLQLPLVLKAKEIGLFTICFAWRDGAVCADVCDKFYPISIVEKEDILHICQKESINGICTIASDVAAPTVAYIAEKMGLIGNSYEASVRANNKFLMREAFSTAAVPCPKYCMVTEAEDLNSINWNYPLIVKPSDRSGSLGVQKVNKPNELHEAVLKALDVSFKKQAMIEEYIEGREISVEFISYQGKHYPLTITDKVTTGAPHFVELEHHQPSSLSQEMYEKIYNITKCALKALGITNGASHSEYKITDDGRVFIMEIGARMGGDFIGSNLVRLSTGYDFLQGVIEVAMGMFHEPQLIAHHHSGVFFLSEETKYIKPIFEHWKEYQEIVDAKITSEELHHVECSGDRSGYLIYQAEKKVYFNEGKDNNGERPSS